MIELLSLAIFPLGPAMLPSGYPIEPVALREVRVHDRFWWPRLVVNAKVTLAHELDELQTTGRLDNFRAAAGDPGFVWKGLVFNDSDVYKVLEACALSRELFPDPSIDRRCDEIVDLIGHAQAPDGYLDTPHQAFERGQKTAVSSPRWASEDWDHELYCAGHLYEAATAYFEATGKRKLLDIAVRNADLVCRRFNAQGDRNVSGHEEIEIGLVKLYRATGERKYLDEARWLIDQRGRPDGRRPLMGPYAQDDRPVTEQPHAEGHAVRASYLYTGMSDVDALLRPAGYRPSLDRFWEDVAGSQIYVTGGIGSTGANEGFTTGFDLPNLTAYCETCASVANAIWNERMFQAEGQAKYIDVAERTLYNAFLSGVGRDGRSFFYPNVLTSLRGARRSPWFDCACCPPNVARLLPTFAGWIYAKSANRLFVNYFVASDLRTNLGNGEVAVHQATDFPNDGRVELKIDASSAGPFELALRIPGWAQGRPIATGLYRFADRQTSPWSVSVNGARVAVHVGTDGYVVLKRSWRRGDRVELSLPMAVRAVVADPRVAEDNGRVAFERGPLIYCAEASAQPGGKLFDVVVASDARPEAGGADNVSIAGEVVARDGDGRPKRTGERVRLRLEPYADWANHGPCGMTVWFPTDPNLARPAPAPTLATTAKVTTSVGWGGDEITDQIPVKSSIDHDHPYLHWWPRKGTHEWVELALAHPSDVSEVRVYWFQDEGMGECRLPKAWNVLVRAPGATAWTPVAHPSTYEIAKDRWCHVTFPPIRAAAVRIEVELPAGFSAGIHQVELK